MVDVIVVGKECNCDPNRKEDWKSRQAIIGTGVIMWTCPHCEIFAKRKVGRWEKEFG